MNMILDEYRTDLTAFVKKEGYWDRDTGKYVEGGVDQVDFTGAILPLSQDDFIKNPNAGYTKDHKKLYTSEDLMNGDEIVFKNQKYAVDSDLDYNYIDIEFKRYYIKRVGEVNA